MTDVVKDVIKGVQTSKQDVYKQKKEEFKGGNTKGSRRSQWIEKTDITNQIIPYSEQVERLALEGPSGETFKMIANINKGFTPEE